MPFPRKYDHELIIRLAREGCWSRKQIADAAGCDVPIVTTVLARARKAGQSIPVIERVSRRGVPMSSYRVREVSGSLPAPMVEPVLPPDPGSSYVPIPGADEQDADRVRRDLERRGLGDLLSMLGLAPTADLRPEEEKAA